MYSVVDYATNYMIIHLIRDDTSELALAAKHDFEHKCTIRGIKVQRYHADYACFSEPPIQDDRKYFGQILTFCGIGAHHQNRIIECKVKDITQAARIICMQ